MMNQAQLKGNWEQVKGHFKNKWGKLTDDDLEASKGDGQKLIGKIVECYGITKEKASEKFDEFLNRFDEEGHEIKSLMNDVSDMMENLNVKAQDMAEQAQAYTKENPLKAVGMAVAAGAAVGVISTLLSQK